MQELQSIAHKSASWEVLQRGGVALSDVWDEYKSTGDAAGYAQTMRKVFFAIAGPLLQSRLALSDAKTKVCHPSLQPHVCHHFGPCLPHCLTSCMRCLFKMVVTMTGGFS